MNAKGIVMLLVLTGCLGLLTTYQTAYGEDTWRTDFDVACAQSNDAMSLSPSELKSQIERCDRLQKIIETEEETVRKVFLKRLQMCKNLYVFVLETKIMEQKPK